jgi:hypothetical protein
VNLGSTSSVDVSTFKIALTNTNTALAGADPTTASLQDFVGIGTGANGREPHTTGTIANNAPPTSNVLAVYRQNCGNQDTDVNNADWANGYPSPRNSATPAANGLTAIGTAFPFVTKELQPLSLRVTPRLCGTSGLNVGTTVTADLTAIGGSATQSLFDDGTNGDDLANDGVYMLGTQVASGTTVGNKVMPVVVSDGSNSGGCYLSLVVNAAATTPDNDNCTSAQNIPGPYASPVTVASPANVGGANIETNNVVSGGRSTCSPARASARSGNNGRDGLDVRRPVLRLRDVVMRHLRQHDDRRREFI